MSDPRPFWLEVEKIFDHLSPVTDPALFAEREARYNPVAELQKWLRRPTERHKYLVTGTIGNGKTSELFHACHQLTAHRMVVFVDLWSHFRHQVGDESALERLEPWELVGLLGLAVIRAGEERFGHQWKDQPKRLETAIKALRTADANDGGAEIDVVKLTQGLAVAAGGVTGAVFGGPLTGAIGAGAAKMAMDTGLAVLGSVADAASWTWRIGLPGSRRRADQDTEVRVLLDAVNALIMDLQKDYGRRLLLVVDGLDRVEDEERLGALFVESALLGDLVCDEVFTVQPLNEVTQRAKSFRCYDLCNVPVLDRQDPKLPGPGIAFFRTLVEKRLAAVRHGLAERGGDVPSEAPIPIEIVDRLAYFSGGVVREFVRMVAFAAGEAWDAQAVALTEDIANEVLRDARRAKEMRINSEEIELLERVMEDPDHALPPGPVAQKLLGDHRLLPYPNETPWYFPNPVLTLALLKPWRSRPSAQ